MITKKQALKMTPKEAAETTVKPDEIQVLKQENGQQILKILVEKALLHLAAKNEIEMAVTEEGKFLYRSK